MNYKELLINKDKVVMTSVELAVIIGNCEEAIVLNQISYWIEKYKDTGRNFKDGRYWVYNSYQKWHEDNFPFWHPSKIQRLFRALENKGLLFSANYNNVSFDKTKWYTINYDKLQELADDYIGQNIQPSPVEDGQPSTAGDYAMFKNEKSLIRNEQPSIAGDYPIPEDTTDNITENTGRYNNILSGKPDDMHTDVAESDMVQKKKSKPKNHPEEIRQVIDYFNRVCGTNYKYQSEATAKLINARLNEGFMVEDFYRVIDKKHEEWANDSEWCKYIRPQTLFRPSHFENYLNQKGVSGSGYTGDISEECRRLYNSVVIE